MSKLFAFLGLLLALSPELVHAAGTGADVLLQSVKKIDGKKGETQTSDQGIAFSGDVELKDPFQMQLFSIWQSESRLPYDVNAWILRVLKKDYEGAAHLFTVVSSKTPASFESVVLATRAYLFWKLGLTQYFVDQWISLSARKGFSDSRIGMALDQSVGQDFDKWFADNAIQLEAHQFGIINGLDLSKGMIVATLRAAAALRKGTAGAKVLEALPIKHAFKIPLAESVALGFAKAGDVSEAAKALKNHLEPAIAAQKDAVSLSSHYLQIARLLYQAGSLDGAEQFYLKIPTGSADYITAREELTWVRLRQGNDSQLRGELMTFTSKLFGDRFGPEVYLVRAISNLKLCFYDEVEKDFRAFLDLNKKWAVKITENLKSADPQPAPRVDYYSQKAAQAIEKRQLEADQINQLSEESITAVLPAVGPQKHWVEARAQILKHIDSAKQRKSDEYRRQWRNMGFELSEAIRKMRFVKVELLSQLNAAKMTSAEDADTIKSSSAAPVRIEVKTESDTLSYPFDGVIWPDELFKLKSFAMSKCLKEKQL